MSYREHTRRWTPSPLGGPSTQGIGDNAFPSNVGSSSARKSTLSTVPDIDEASQDRDSTGLDHISVMHNPFERQFSQHSPPPGRPVPLRPGGSSTSNAGTSDTLKNDSSHASTDKTPASAPIFDDTTLGKTKRHVQWASGPARTKSPLLESPGTEDGSQLSTHALDELGLDPAAFHQLKAALERHKSDPNSSSHGASKLLDQLSLAQGPRGPQVIIDSASTSADVTGSSSPQDPFEEQQPVDDLDTYIPPGERDGLPAPLDHAPLYEKKARRLILGHKFGFGFGSSSESKSRRGRTKTKKADKQINHPFDVEKRGGPNNGTGMNGKTFGTGGVLSSLLALYGHQEQRQSNSNESTPTSTVFDPDEGGEGSHRRTSHSSSVPGTPGESSPNKPFQSSHRRASSYDNLMKQFKPSTRPVAARSAGGVFGGLIASTNNLAGVATPAASALAPIPNRSGFHVSRYYIPEKAQHAKQDRSSRRTSNERPATPSSAHGSSGNTPGTATPGDWTPPTTGRKSSESSPGTPSGTQTPAIKRASWAGVLHGLPLPPTPAQMWAGVTSRPHTPVAESIASSEWTEKDTAVSQTERRARRRKEKRKREEVYITLHVAEILQRQEFIMKLTRALMMFGAPSHRLEAQIQATARVLDTQVSCLYLPGVMLLSFGDSATHTSETKFLKQGSNLDLGKLLDAHMLYWQVTHDQIGVTEASAALDTLMRKRVLYKGWVTVLIGGFCSAFITPVSFQGSFVDACIAFPLGCLLVLIQNLASKNELYSNVFEITIATLLSFLAAAVASTHQFCYAAVASGAVVLILPGYIVLCGALELASRNIISGAVRLGYSVIYSLFLGFGLAIGGEMYHQVSGKTVYNADDYSCGYTHNPNGPWYQRTPPTYWAFLCVPMYSLFLSLRNQAPIRKELPVTILISCAGWAANHFASEKFVNRSDITSAIGSLVVGILGNTYGRFSSGNAFVVMITGILFQLPSGLANGGLLAFASDSNKGSTDSYSQGFSVAEQLISVAIGLTVGLFVSAALVHPFGSKRRGAGLFSL